MARPWLRRLWRGRSAGIGTLLVVLPVSAANEDEEPRGVPPGYAEQPAVLGPYQRGRIEQELPQAGRPEYVWQRQEPRHVHDGLYLRIAGGVGLAALALDAESQRFATPASGDREGRFDGAARAWAIATELGCGFTPARGLVIGLGVYTLTVPSAEAKEVGVGSGRYSFSLSQLAIVSPFADWYFDPSAGFHVQAGLGLATLVMGPGEPTGLGPRLRPYTAVGVGAHVGIGYEWWIADEWSVGVLGRLTHAALWGRDAEGVAWKHRPTGGAVLLSATYH
jgi:hypothetical protein